VKTHAKIWGRVFVSAARVLPRLILSGKGLNRY